MKAGMLGALLMVASGVQADTITKCLSPEGKVTWTNQPCTATDTAVPVAVQPTVTDSSGLRDWARRNPARPVVAARPARAEQKFINPVECQNARRAYEFELGWKYSKPGERAYRRRQVCQECGACP